MSSARENTPAQNLLASLFFLAVGAAILFVGFKINNSPADCGGETMSAGDTCVSYSGSHQTGSNNLDEQKSENSTSANWAFVVGGLVILASACGSVAALRDMSGSFR
ncbi:hypothetical protein [Streptomyces sp. NRRL F-2664]|uniref:hypothetical protein n=1 Tax=Streptomyces sp. NRRL F-2664 TaxID=1463842 RepID=UPI00131C91A1|nr:hypothetical protein [Streptomyces sp. NRRL F-2664]